MKTNINIPKSNNKESEEKEKQAIKLDIAYKELAFQNEEKEKRAAELVIANKELIFQNEEKVKLAIELITSEIRYRRLFESAMDGIIILNPGTGMIVDVNPFLLKMLGIPKKNLQDKQFGI